MKGPATTPASKTSQRKAEKPSDAETTNIYEGRVLDSAGRPFSGAAVYLISSGLRQPKNPPVRATSGTDGRFRFAVPKSDFDAPDSDALWPYSTVVARAKGFAFGMANDQRGDGKGLTLQLVRGRCLHQRPDHRPRGEARFGCRCEGRGRSGTSRSVACSLAEGAGREERVLPTRA